MAEAQVSPASGSDSSALSERPPLYAISRTHLDQITGPLGIYQHARGSLPNPEYGYCTDDVARALIVDMDHWPDLGWDAVEPSATRSMEFLVSAFDGQSGWFRNMRHADGSWLPPTRREEDAHARALLALARTAADAPREDLQGEAAGLFVRAWPTSAGFWHLRPVAGALLAASIAVPAGLPLQAPRQVEPLLRRLYRSFEGRPAAWPWPHPVLTYEAALLPQALIAGGELLRDSGATDLGLRILDWLAASSVADGVLEPVGNRGWWPREGPRARFDQQPIEAGSLALAAETAYRATGEDRYRDVLEKAYAWFLGSNALGLSVADPHTGGCRDGLCEDGLNTNQGAESTLMWLLAAAATRRVRSPRPSPRP